MKLETYKIVLVDNHISNFVILRFKEPKKLTFGFSIEDLIGNFKKTKNHYTPTFEKTFLEYAELLSEKEYNSIDELEYDYLQELIWNWKFMKLFPFIGILL